MYLPSCSENHCGKCALILLSLIWLTEKGMMTTTMNLNCFHNLSMVILLLYKRIVWHHWVWCSSRHDKVILYFLPLHFYTSDMSWKLNVFCQNNMYCPALQEILKNIILSYTNLNAECRLFPQPSVRWK